MFEKKWGMKDGFAIGIGIIAIGLVLQFSVGAVDWSLLRWPVNIIIMTIFAVAAVVFYALRSRIHILR